MGHERPKEVAPEPRTSGSLDRWSYEFWEHGQSGENSSLDAACASVEGERRRGRRDDARQEHARHAVGQSLDMNTVMKLNVRQVLLD